MDSDIMHRPDASMSLQEMDPIMEEYSRRKKSSFSTAVAPQTQLDDMERMMVEIEMMAEPKTDTEANRTDYTSASKLGSKSILET